ncbi:MAG: phage tail tube protein [Bacteroidota bacterium]
MTTGVMDGNLWILMVDDTAVGCLTSNSLSQSRDTRDTTCKTGTANNNYRTFLPSFISGTISFEGLHAEDESNESSYEIETKFKNGTLVNWKIGSTVTGDKYYSGSGYFTQLDLKGGSAGENVTYSGSIQISGAVTQETNS